MIAQGLGLKRSSCDQTAQTPMNAATKFRGYFFPFWQVNTSTVKDSTLCMVFNVYPWVAVFIAYLVLSVDLFVPWKQEQRNGPDHRLAQEVSNGIC